VSNASTIIAQRLYDAGCRHAFGIPGGEVLALMEALDQVGIKVTLAKHENCAGFMGEGVYHHDGAPAILIATIGPGLANAVNVIANAVQDQVPMIVLTGCVPALLQHTYTHQVFDHVRLADEITKAAFRVEAGTAGVVADKAVAIATSGRPGPVLLDVPIDVQNSLEERAAVVSRQPDAPMVPAPAAELEQARAWLSEAENPLVIAGVDVLSQDCAGEVADFCRRFNAPLITTYKAKGIISEDDPLALGGAGLSPLIDEVLLPVVKASDLVVLAGYDPIEMRTGWQNPWSDDARVIEFSAEGNLHYMHQARFNFVGDVGAGLEVLGDGVTGASKVTSAELEAIKAQIADRLNLGEEWGPAAVVDEARKALPGNTIATVDSGAHRILLSQAWACLEPRGLLQSTALCTMGCAVPLAIGRKLAEPDRPVVAFVGDAGLEMFLGELATARDLKHWRSISVPPTSRQLPRHWAATAPGAATGHRSTPNSRQPWNATASR
jgi:acetolactate synthase-1/2/3 large subunit